MRVLKWIGGLLILLVAAFFLIGMILPRQVEVARSIEIDAPPDQVFPHVNSPEAAQAWSPWLDLDPNVSVTFNEIKAGEGAVMEWASENPQVGAGRMEVIESMDNEKVVSALDFGDMGTAQAIYSLEDMGGKTRITWGLDADMGSGPMGRWMGLMMDNWVGADYERGLAQLKALVEEP